MATGWLDCSSGASGDMLLGALVAAGAPLDAMQRAVDALGVEPVRLVATGATRGGVAAVKVDVQAPPSDVARRWPDVRRLLADAGPALAAAPRAVALEAFERLARAEAAVHGTGPDDVHFHEVGALDALADVVGTAVAVTLLDLDALTASPVSLGGGTAHGAHGALPVPAPATLEILRAAGAPVRGGPVDVELCTPTGAALLATLVSGWGPLPTMRVTATGAGAGSRELTGIPNVLRVVLGTALPAAGAAGTRGPDDGGAVVVESNVDDMDPRLWPAVLGRLLAAGASDAWLTPILMKKGRPAHTLSVLTPASRLDAVHEVVFTETSAIGVRVHAVDKTALPRDEVEVAVDGERVRVKVARYAGRVVNAQPEYDDVAAAAQALGRPVKSVLAAAVAEAAALPSP